MFCNTPTTTLFIIRKSVERGEATEAHKLLHKTTTTLFFILTHLSSTGISVKKV
jgi:hypothetical protein